MDPTKCLEEIRELVERVHKNELYDARELHDVLNELAEKMEALDNWMMTGGFMPNQWYEARSGLPPATQPATVKE